MSEITYYSACNLALKSLDGFPLPVKAPVSKTVVLTKLHMAQWLPRQIMFQIQGKACLSLCKCVVLTYPVLGEERLSDTWYIPRVLPEMLEFL